METVVPKNVTENESIIDLLQKLVCPDNFTQERILTEKFRIIFFGDLWNRCETVCKNQFRKRTDCKQITEDIFSDSIITALQELKKFKLPENVVDNKEAKKVIDRWLAKIVNNRILEQFGILKKEKKNLDSYKDFLKLRLENGAVGIREVEKSYDASKMVKVWNELCDFSKEIILISYNNDCFPYFDHITREFNKNTKHLPKDIRKNLIEKHQTTDANYRKVKQRAFEAIFSCAINLELVK